MALPFSYLNMTYIVLLNVYGKSQMGADLTVHYFRER